MVIKTKRISIRNEQIGRKYLEEIRKTYSNDIANKVKLIGETRFNVPVYNFGTNKPAFYIPELIDWYLEFPEEITISM